MNHTPPCCSNCDPEYLSKELGRHVCCHLQLQEESLDADEVEAPLIAMRPTTSELEQKAQQLATQAHQSQTDHNGDPYILHPAAVAHLVTKQPDYASLTEQEQETVRIAAWLHDVIEDTDITLDDLRTEGFNETTLQIVAALTRTANEAKEHYYQRILHTGELARLVKLADLAHNTDVQRRNQLPGSPQRPTQPGEPDRYSALGRKYAHAYQALKAEIPEHLTPFTQP